jgi:hypothetical protein
VDVSSSGGIVKIEQVAPTSYPSTYNLDSGTSITVEAVPDFGYAFNGWSEDLSGTTNPTILMIDCDKSITANFSVNWLLIGGTTGGLALIGALIVVLIIRRRAH